MTNIALIIFQKNPILGKVKSRLAKDIGDNSALEVYKVLVELTCQQAALFAADKWSFFSDEIPKKSQKWLFASRLQKGSDLGEKMKNAFQEVFEKGYQNVLIIGTDCPSISVDILEEAVEKLKSSDLVLGPAVDGGYYLLGMNQLHFELFQQIAWSTDQVLRQTLDLAQKLRLSVSFLKEFYDIDTLEDLSLFIAQNPKYEYLQRPHS